MTKCFLTIVLVGLVRLSSGQVTNNNIGNRLLLALDNAPLHSTTAKSSVEWNCINKILTNKCLVYHNDQWFNFSVFQAGTYFLNISGQECRDKQGVQVLIIEGNPCETETYKILRCIAKIRQEDIFIKMDSVKTGVSYLVNIDGFLGDFCDFEVQISTKPLGLPLHIEMADTVPAAGTFTRGLFNLKWHLNEDKIEHIQKFKVYRSSNSHSKSRLIGEQSVRRNAYGFAFLDYETSDTLIEEGNYQYRVFSIQKETLLPQLMAEREVRYFRPVPKPVQQRAIKLSLEYPDKTLLQVLVYDRTNNKKLSATMHKFSAILDRDLEIDLGDFLDSGVKQFLVLVSDSNAKGALEFYYRIDRNGKFVRE